jgi:hypothetical protein
MASVAIHNGESSKKGDNVMIAGLAFQVATMLVFILISADFAWRTFRNRKVLPQPVPNHGEAKPNRSLRFKSFLVALTLSTLCIFTRCVFRVAELSQGWRGHLATTQKYFIGLEGAVVVASVLLLNLRHPGFCFSDAKDVRALQPGRKGCFLKRRSRVDQEEANDAPLARVTMPASR